MPVERPRTVRFLFEGREITATEGQSLGGALLGSGVTVLTRSSKYRRPRGLYCAHGHCPNCLLHVDGAANVRACMVEVAEGMRAGRQGSASRNVDPFRSLNQVGRLFPVGFQYRLFKRQNLAWRAWEAQLRRLAADTDVPASFDIPAGERTAADLLVVGAGPAGLAAAAAAAQRGLRVVLVGRRRGLGGAAAAVLAAGTRPAGLASVASAVAEAANVTVIAPATVVAGFGDKYVVDGVDRAIEVTAGASILATGAYERAVPFPGNDRPGVMLTSALRRLVLADGILTSASVVLVTDNDSAYAMADELSHSGVRIRAIVDTRSGSSLQVPPAPPGAEVLLGARIIGVRGRSRVTGLAVATAGSTRIFQADVIGMSGGWQPADELRYSATSTGTTVVIGERAMRIDASAWRSAPLPVLQGVGAAVGTLNLAGALAEGRLAGTWAGVRGTGPAETAAMADAIRELPSDPGENAHGR
jgi:sarcosine oxidase, subunit alpha